MFYKLLLDIHSEEQAENIVSAGYILPVIIARLIYNWIKNRDEVIFMLIK